MQPKNLLFIISDQHQRDALGCYGHPFVQTPHLDGLAERGTRFDAAYTNCPICVPARASLATGQYVHQIGYWDNAFPYEGRVPGWGHRLIEAGHRVESIGKLHYRSDDDADGFGKHIVPLNVVGGQGDVMGSFRDDLPVREGARVGVSGAGPGSSTYLDYDDDIAAHTADWLAERRTESDRGGADGGEEAKPWVCFVSFVCPHPPYIAPQELYDLYPLDKIPLPDQWRLDERPSHPAFENFRRVMQWEEPFTEEEMRRMMAAYYGCCTHLDRNVGKVLNALEANGFSDDTRIIYTSDHGESMGNRGLWGKFTMYEESAAVPFLMAGPDVPAGEVSNDPITLVDCYQTILDAVGVEPTADEADLPGTSLWPIANGECLNRVAFSEYHAVASHNAYYMLRDGQFKYVHFVNAAPQLFNLKTDPRELVNLAGDPAHQALLEKLKAKLSEILDPEAVDAQAKADQEALIERHGGRQAVLDRGTFTNSPVPGETPAFQSTETNSPSS